MTRWLILPLLVVVTTWSGGCGSEKETPTTQSSALETTPTVATEKPAPRADVPQFDLPDVDISGLPMILQTKIGDAHYQARQSPEAADKVGTLGMLYCVQGFPKPAVACLKQAAALAPEAPAWSYYLGLACEKAGDKAGAIAAYEKTLSVGDGYPPARIRLGGLLIDRQPERAAELFNEILKLLPESPAAQMGLGKLAQAAGRLDDAAGYYRRALEFASTYGPAHRALADVLRAQGKTEEAERHARQAVGGDEVTPLADPLETAMLERGLAVEAIVRTAITAAENRDLARADSMLRVASEIDPDNPVVRNAVAYLKLVQGQAAEAADIFRSLLEADPELHQAKSNLALALAAQKQYEEAERRLREVVAARPENTVALDRLCRLLSTQERSDEAMALVKQVLDAAPDDAALRLRVADMLARQGRLAEAMEATRAALALRPTYSAARNSLGELLLHTGDLEGARREYNTALENNPADMTARLALTRIALSQKDYTAAEHMLRGGLGHAPDSPEAPSFANTLAWILATSPNSAQRKGEEAAKWAEWACERSNYSDPAHLDTLAAAYAEAGRFDDARRWISEAIRLAQLTRQANLMRDCQQRQALYAENKPFHEAE